jgi:nondiscriminating glutamyl-tRNA synthetase
MDLHEMESQFGLDRLNPAGAVFDRVKLKWMNAQHLRALPNAEIYQLILPHLKDAGLKLPSDLNWQMKSVETFKPYLEILSDAVALYSPLDDSRYEILAESDEALKWEGTKPVLNAWVDAVKAHPTETFTEADFLKIQDLVKNNSGQKGKNLFFPIRIALIGKPHGAELKILVPLMNKSSILERAAKAIERS